MLAAAVFGQETATITHAGDFDSTFQSVLNEVKKEGFDVESASKDAGIKTAMTITGKYKQTGSHLELTFISDNPSQTSVRVSVLEQKRYKGLKTEPWSDPKTSVTASKEEAGKLKAALGW